MGKISVDAPISEVVLRRYEKPINLKERMLVRKLCLSLGLLQPGESRDVIVDVFYVLLKSRMTPITCDTLEKNVIGHLVQLVQEWLVNEDDQKRHDN